MAEEKDFDINDKVESIYRHIFLSDGTERTDEDVITPGGLVPSDKAKILVKLIVENDLTINANSSKNKRFEGISKENKEKWLKIRKFFLKSKIKVTIKGVTYTTLAQLYLAMKGISDAEKKAEEVRKKELKKVEKKAEEAVKKAKAKEESKRKKAEDRAKIKKQTEESSKKATKVANAKAIVAEDENDKRELELEELIKEAEDLNKQEILAEDAGDGGEVKTIKTKKKEVVKDILETGKAAAEVTAAIFEGAAKAFEEAEKRDAKEEKSDVKNVELTQVPQEQSFEQQDVNQASQEQQLEEQVNAEAVVFAEAEVIEEAKASETVLKHEVQVTVKGFDDYNTVEDDIKINIDEKEEEEDELEDKLIRYNRLLVDLGKLIDKLTVSAPLNRENQDFVDVLDKILKIQDRLGPLDSIQGFRKIINKIQRKLKGQRGEEIRLARSQVRGLEQLERGERLFFQLQATNKAIDEIKERLLNDGLVSNGLQGIEAPLSQGADKVLNAVEELTNEIQNFGVNDNVLEGIERLFEIVSADTRQVLVDVVTNTISEVDIAGVATLPSRIVTQTLMRFMARLLYSGTDSNDEQSEQNIRAFMENGDVLEGRNRTVVERLLDALKVVIPRPPDVPTSVRSRVGTRLRQVRRRGNVLRKGLEKDLSKVAQKVKESSSVAVNRLSGFIDRFRSNVEEELKESDAEEIIMRFLTSRVRQAVPFDEVSASDVISKLTTEQKIELARQIDTHITDQEIAETGLTFPILYPPIPLARIARIQDPESFREALRNWFARTLQILKRRTKRSAGGEKGERLRETLQFQTEEEKGVKFEDVVASELPPEEVKSAFSELGTVVANAARAIITVEAFRSPEEILTAFVQKAGENIEILEGAEAAVREVIANAAPEVLRDGARGIAADVAGILAQDQFFGGLPVGIILGIIAPVILGLIANSYYSPITEETITRVTEREQGIRSTGTTTEFKKGEEIKVLPEDIDKPQGIGLLRADFKMLGIEFFNEKFAITPLKVENSEWAEFDYVNVFDRTNGIEISNELNDKVRFQEPMFLPKYQAPVAPPSRRAVIMGRDTMIDQIQISQSFAPKFTGAVSIYDNLSQTFNNDEFSRSWRDNILYHPDSSTW